MGKRVGICAIGVLLVLGAAMRSGADPAAEARIHFQMGIAQLRQGRVEPALEKFFLANRLAPNTNIVFNIALCLDRLNRPYEAYVFYRQLLSDPGLEAADQRRAKAALGRLLPRIARLDVVTRPPGAVIYVDRRALGSFGTSPRVLAVPPGKRIIMAELPGYQSAHVETMAVLGQQSRVELTLLQVVGTVRVESSVAGGTVWVDDQTAPSVGLAPKRLLLPPGPHTVFLRVPGHWPAQQQFILRADEEKRLNFKPTPLPAPVGTLEVTSNVIGALVVLDSQGLGISPLVTRDLAAGPHHIRVFAEGYSLWEGNFTLPPRGRARVAVQLERMPRRTRRGPWPWITLGLTGAALVATSAVGGLAVRNHRSYSETEAPSLSDLRRGTALNISADSLIGFTAAAGLGAALAFALTTPDRALPSRGRVEIRHAPAPTLTPATARTPAPTGSATGSPTR